MNGRVIRSQNLSQALLEGFSPLVEKGRFPVGMLRLTVDPAFVDVNVHPTKLEVRFAEPRPVFSLVYRAVSKALEAYRADSVLPKHFDFLARKAEAQREVPTTASRIDETCAVEKKSENDDMAVVEAKKTLPASQVERQKGASGRLYFPESAFNKKPLEKEITLSSKASVGKAKLALELYTPFNGDRAVLDRSQASQSANSEDECQQRIEIANKVAAEPQQEKVIAASEVERHSDYLQQSELWHGTNATEAPQFKVLGQVYKTFIVGLCEGKLWLVDQHTAQERINYEKFANIQALSERSQGLLIPEIVEFTPQVSQFLQDSLDSFCEYGYEVENFGPDRFALRGVPVALPLQKAAATFAELVEELAGEFISVRGNVREHMREKIRAMASCKAAVKAGDVLSFEAMEGLVNNMLKVEHSLYCPHGRPTRIILEEKVLERLFHRI